MSHSRFPVFQWAREIHPYPEVEIHPETAKERGIVDREWVWIDTPKGRCKQVALVTDKIHPCVVNATYGWWYPEKPAPEHGCFENSLNAILSYSPPYDPPTGTPTLMALMCEISKVGDLEGRQ